MSVVGLRVVEVSADQFAAYQVNQVVIRTTFLEHFDVTVELLHINMPKLTHQVEICNRSILIRGQFISLIQLI